MAANTLIRFFTALIFSLLALVGKGQEVILYKCQKDGLVIDGMLDEALWSKATHFSEFQHLVSREQVLDSTQVAIIALKEGLVIGAKIFQADIKANLTTRDTLIYKESCFEVFLDPYADGSNYYELQINASGTLADFKVNRVQGMIIADKEAFQLGDSLYATQVNGTINDSSDIDAYWTAEILIPWSEFDYNFSSLDNHWAFNFMRVDWREQVPFWWATSPTGKRSIHLPQLWDCFLLKDQK